VPVILRVFLFLCLSVSDGKNIFHDDAKSHLNIPRENVEGNENSFSLSGPKQKGEKKYFKDIQHSSPKSGGIIE